MRYLTSISLALIVLMALACSSGPTATPTPPGPMLTEAEAIAVVKNYLDLKTLRRGSCGSYVAMRDPRWSARYDGEGVWKVKVDTVDETVAHYVGSGGTYTAEQLRQRSKHPGKWDLYEKTKSVVVTSNNNC